MCEAEASRGVGILNSTARFRNPAGYALGAAGTSKVRRRTSRFVRSCMSSARSASSIPSTATARQAPGAHRRVGAASTAQASEAQEARTARFSLIVRSGSWTTSRGCAYACAGCSRLLRSSSNRLGEGVQQPTRGLMLCHSLCISVRHTR